MHPRQGAPAHRGRAGCRQDHALPCARAPSRARLQAYTVHLRPAARGCHRRLDLRPRVVVVPLPPGPHLRADHPRRRDQPREPEGAKRAARGDGGAPGHRRRRDAPASRAVLRDRDAEPDAPGRDLSAARISPRPFPHAHPSRLPGRQGRARAAQGRRAARPHPAARAGDEHGAADGAAKGGADHAGLRCVARLCAAAHQPHAPFATLHAGTLAARGCGDPARRAGVGDDGRPAPGVARGRAGDPALGRGPSPARQRRGRERRLRRGRCDPVCAGDFAHFNVSVETPSQTRFAIAIRRRGEEAIYADVVPGETSGISIPVATRRRGVLRSGRLEVFTRYPVGFFHAWSYIDFGLTAVVYPKPDPFAGSPPAQSRSMSEEGIPVPGEEEFNMLRAYRAGDPPRQIAWKALARERGLLTKEFSAMASSELWIDWEEARAADLESRLSVLAHWVLQAESFGQSYGLRIPGTVVPPNRGDLHRARCLEALALFDNPAASDQP